jgi:hypothetical protein
MYVHLDELENLYANTSGELSIAESDLEIKRPAKKSFSFSSLKLPKIKLLSELKILIILFIIVFSGFFFFTNARLVLLTINDTFATESKVAPEDLKITSVPTSQDHIKQKAQKLNELEDQFTNLQASFRTEKELAPTMKEFLAKKQETHSIEFNTLPPTNRLIIPDLNINTPLIDVPIKGEEDFSEGQFDEELMQGAVKYPTTPAP